MNEKVLSELAIYNELERRRELKLCRTNLYWLLTEMLGREDMKRPWLEARCREVQSEPNNHLDIWGRVNYKKTKGTI